MRKLIFIAFNMQTDHGAYQQCLCPFPNNPLPESELELKLELKLKLKLEHWLLLFVGSDLLAVCFSSRIS